MSAKRQAIFTIAAELFHQHGIRRVSVEEICRRAESSKVTFYKHFKNKMDLAISILDTEINRMAEAQYAILDDPERCFAEKFHAMMRLDRQQMHSMGSALMEDVFSGELPEIEAFMHSLMESHKERMTAFFLEGQAAGLFNPNLTPDLFFYLQQHIMTLFQDKQLQAIVPDSTARAEVIADLLTFGIMNRPKEMQD